MNFWILAFIALTFQETISTSVLFAVAYNENHSVVALTAIFIFVTLAQTCIFHAVGLKMQTKGSRNIIVDLSRIYILRADHFIRRWGIKIFIVFLTSVVFPPFLTAFISSWLNLPFRKKLFYILLGDCIWYLTPWVIVVGTNIITENPSKLVIRVISISLLFVILERYIANRLLTKWN